MGPGLPYTPFTRREWCFTLLLALVCFGLPLGLILGFQAGVWP